MVSITVRHQPGQGLRELLAGLARAWRRVRQGGCVQRIWTKRVSASVRAWDITHGANGWHPHVHVLLRTTEWHPEEKQALLERWIDVVREELGPGCVPSEERAVRWSTPIDTSKCSETSRAAYVAKLGLEVAGTAKQARGRSRTVWDIARAAVAGSEEATALWHEYYGATRGKRALELDDRAAAYAKAAGAIPDKWDGDTTEQTIVVPVDALEMRALRQYEQTRDPTAVGYLLDLVTTSRSPPDQVAIYIDLVMTDLRGGLLHAVREGP
jgi:hypothetical protein